MTYLLILSAVQHLHPVVKAGRRMVVARSNCRPIVVVTNHPPSYSHGSRHDVQTGTYTNLRDRNIPTVFGGYVLLKRFKTDFLALISMNEYTLVNKEPAVSARLGAYQCFI